MGRCALRGSGRRWRGRCQVIPAALEQLVVAMAPDLLAELVKLGQLAIAGASKEELAAQSERFAMLAIYKASYREA